MVDTLTFTLLMGYAGNFWRDEDNRRKFFNNYAFIRGFDPLVAQNWHDVKREDVTVEKV